MLMAFERFGAQRQGMWGHDWIWAAVILDKGAYQWKFIWTIPLLPGYFLKWQN
jgi:hypothetical protein